MSANIEPTAASDNWCRTTKGESVKTMFTWTIEGFLDRKENKFNESLESVCFSVTGPEDRVSKWNMKLYPQGHDDADRDYKSLMRMLLINTSL